MAFQINISGAMRGMDAAGEKARFAVESYGKAAAAKLERTAKSEAPWTDRTGNARQTLRGVTGWEGDTLRVGVTGNMEYSPYLEFRWNGRFAILWPTVNKLRAEILRGMGGLLK